MIIFETMVDGVSQPALERFAAQARKLVRVPGEVAVLITHDQRIRELNRRFRRKNKATDVLSFPREGGGDIAICAEIAADNAARLGHSVTDELKVLVLHAMLHLAGYDHETDNGIMKEKEIQLRSRLKLPGGLIERTLARAGRQQSRTTHPKRSKNTHRERGSTRSGR